MISRVTVIGLGLIGGSVALGLRRIGGFHLAAIDRANVLASPMAEQAADERVCSDDADAVAKVLDATELAILAVPVGAIVGFLPEALKRSRFVTDCGSTKAHIAAVAKALPRGSAFVPGHPMTGKPVGGLEHACADLFQGARWLLCPAGCDPLAVQVVEDVVQALGASTVAIDAQEHDRGVALTSHLPQLFASALAVLAAEYGAWQVAGPGFASATRVAGGAESMWRDILSTNAPHIACALRALTRKLESVAGELECEPPELDTVLKLLSEARSTRWGG